MRLRRAGPAQSRQGISDPASLRRTGSRTRPWRQARFPRTSAVLRMTSAHFPVVIARAGGVSITPRRRTLSAAPAITGSSAGACHLAALRADPLADDDYELQK